MTDKQKAEIIVNLIGGKENIVDAFNCMTRCRFIVKDASKVNYDKLQDEKFVMGAQDSAGQVQVIVGPGVAQKVTDEILLMVSIDEEEKNNWQANKEQYKKNSKVSEFLKKIGQIFMPMIPGFIAAGLFLGFANILGNMAVSDAIAAGIPKEEAVYSTAYYYFQALGMALYAYLIIFTGINTAKAFGGTEILGGIIGGFILSPTLTPLILSIFESPTQGQIDFATGLPGDGGVFGAMFAVMFMSFIEKKIKKVMPGMLNLIATPFLTLLICGVSTIIFMVLAAQLTLIIGEILNVLVYSEGLLSIISGAVIAGTFLPLVTLGLHQGLTPIYVNEIATQGATYIFPIAAMAGAGQVGSSFAIWLQARKIKDVKMQEIIAGSIVPGILGVGEPLIYGVTLPLGKPFVTAGLGAAFGGAYIAWAHVGAVATGPSGLTALPLILPEDMLQFLIGLVISYVMAFIITTFFFKYKGPRA